MPRTPDDIHDELLVLECQGGRESALRGLIERWHVRLARFACRLTGDSESARDALQETWLAVVAGIGGLDDPARFRVWVYRIAANKCADAIRRRGADRRAMKAEAASRPQSTVTPDGFSAREDIGRMQNAIPRWIMKTGRRSRCITWRAWA